MFVLHVMPAARCAAAIRAMAQSDSPPSAQRHRWPALRLPPSTTLLLGVVSWPAKEHLRRRQAIRRLAGTFDGLATLRFLMVAETEASEPDDVLRYELPHSEWSGLRAHVGKFWLCNAFLRHAATLQVAHVGRADDDALFNASAIALQLAMQHLDALLEGKHLGYGGEDPPRAGADGGKIFPLAAEPGRLPDVRLEELDAAQVPPMPPLHGA